MNCTNYTLERVYTSLFLFIMNIFLFFAHNYLKNRKNWCNFNHTICEFFNGGMFKNTKRGRIMEDKIESLANEIQERRRII